MSQSIHNPVKPAPMTLAAMLAYGINAFELAAIFDVHWSTAYRWIRQMPGYVHKTEILREKLTALHGQGKTPAEMAKAVGHTETWVRERLIYWGLMPKAFERRTVDQRRVDMLVECGCTPWQIMKALGCGRTTAYRRVAMSKAG